MFCFVVHVPVPTDSCYMTTDAGLRYAFYAQMAIFCSPIREIMRRRCGGGRQGGNCECKLARSSWRRHACKTCRIRCVQEPRGTGRRIRGVPLTTISRARGSREPIRVEWARAVHCKAGSHPVCARGAPVLPSPLPPRAPHKIGTPVGPITCGSFSDSDVFGSGPEDIPAVADAVSRMPADAHPVHKIRCFGVWATDIHGQQLTG